jgi:hypothetical protein
MFNLIIFSFLVYGICNIIIYGSIFTWFREYLKYYGEGDYSLYKLFTCFMCLPTWVGMFLSYVFISNGNYDLSPLHSVGFNKNIYLTVFFDGLLSSGLVYFINTIVEKLEK